MAQQCIRRYNTAILRVTINSKDGRTREASEVWRRNVYLISFAQFLVVVGFAFVNPFMPLFLRELGSLTDSQASLWGGLGIAASPLGMFVSAPLWGMVADRWGRKLMVLRAMFGGGVVLAFTSLAPNIYWVVGLRFLQGLLSGSLAGASALIASSTPRERLPFSIGLLMAAMFAGQSVGPLLGGIVADAAGFRESFLVTAALLFLAGIVIAVFVKERFSHTPRDERASFSAVIRLAGSRQMLPLLIVIAALAMGPQIIGPIIPLFISQFDTETAAATLSGIALAAMGALAAISASVFGRIAGCVSIKKVIIYSCLGCTAIYLPPVWAATVVQLIVFIALLGLFKGGLMASSSSLIGISVPAAQMGVAFGLGQSANALGHGLGPVLGGMLGAALGLRPVFAITAILFLVVAVLGARFLMETPAKKAGS